MFDTGLGIVSAYVVPDFITLKSLTFTEHQMLDFVPLKSIFCGLIVPSRSTSKLLRHNKKIPATPAGIL
jgi:hypothetical protein